MVLMVMVLMAGADYVSYDRGCAYHCDDDLAPRVRLGYGKNIA